MWCKAWITSHTSKYVIMIGIRKRHYNYSCVLKILTFSSHSALKCWYKANKANKANQRANFIKPPLCCWSRDLTCFYGIFLQVFRVRSSWRGPSGSCTTKMNSETLLLFLFPVNRKNRTPEGTNLRKEPNTDFPLKKLNKINWAKKNESIISSCALHAEQEVVDLFLSGSRIRST